MKVLIAADGTVLSFPTIITESGIPNAPDDGQFFLGLDGKAYLEGTVKTVDDALVKRWAVAATKQPIFLYAEAKDFMRDLKWINTAIMDVAEGAVVKPKHRGRGYSLDIPKSATPDRTVGLGIGAVVAVGPNISPRALMNARGTVTAIAGGKVTVALDAGDADRLSRATGKKYGATLRIPAECAEVVTAAPAASVAA